MATLPATLSALSTIDFRQTKPDAWTAINEGSDVPLLFTVPPERGKIWGATHRVWHASACAAPLSPEHPIAKGLRWEDKPRPIWFSAKPLNANKTEPKSS